MIQLVMILLLSVLTNDSLSCAMKDTSVVHFGMFSTQTMLPITKQNFQGAKLVIKNAVFKKLIKTASHNNNEVFFENIRMKVFLKKKVYFINQQGVIEVDKSVVGTLNKTTRDHLDLGYDFYEWETCRPLNGVLPEMYKEMKEHRKGSKYIIYGPEMK